MNAIVSTIAPVFGLILIGYLTMRFRVVSDAAAKGLAEFAFMIAMPALLFRTMVTAESTSSSPGSILAAFFIADAIVWIVATLAAIHLIKRTGLEATALAMASTFGNTVMLGLPLGIAYYGDAATPALALIIAVHAPLLWLVASVQAEWMTAKGSVDLGGRVRDLVKDVATTPIVFGVVLGSLWRASDLGLHEVPDKLLSMLGTAGIPASLFALGASLSRYSVRSDLDAMGLVLVLKLLAFPIAAYILAVHVFALPPMAANAVVLLAACPTGANAFLFAQRYDSAVGPVSASVAAGTVIAALTISVLFAVMN